MKYLLCYTIAFAMVLVAANAAEACPGGRVAKWLGSKAAKLLPRNRCR